MQPFHADIAITSAFNGLPSVFDSTTPLDGVPPTWRIKSTSLRCVGPEQLSELRFATSVVTTEAMGTTKAAATSGRAVSKRFLSNQTTTI